MHLMIMCAGFTDSCSVTVTDACTLMCVQRSYDGRSGVACVGRGSTGHLVACSAAAAASSTAACGCLLIAPRHGCFRFCDHTVSVLSCTFEVQYFGVQSVHV